MNKTFFSRWRQGMRELTPLQLLEAKLFGIIGQFCGLFLACGYLWFSGFRFFLVFMFFTLFLLVVEFINSWKSYDRMIGFR